MTNDFDDPFGPGPFDTSSATVTPIETGATVTADDVYWTYRGEPQRGTVTRTYSRRFGTQMARVHWQDGSYSAVEVGRLTAEDMR